MQRHERHRERQHGKRARGGGERDRKDLSCHPLRERIGKQRIQPSAEAEDPGHCRKGELQTYAACCARVLQQDQCQREGDRRGRIVLPPDHRRQEQQRLHHRGAYRRGACACDQDEAPYQDDTEDRAERAFPEEELDHADQKRDVQAGYGQCVHVAGAAERIVQLLIAVEIALVTEHQ